ncbi:MAG: hypothetical protein GXY44_10485 [Phycisphaerales bacterium]|nr:hypothetical protein [Phycisphaerales bacterium]
MLTPTRKITVAAGQISALLMNEAAATLEQIEATIATAAGLGAELLVLPECAYPAYLLGSIHSYRVGDHLSSADFLGWLRKQAARRGLHIVCGFVEDTGDVLHNTAILLDDRGDVLGLARKRFLWHADHEWYTPGTEIRVINSRIGRIGILICAEARVPEIIATLANDGAELLAMSTCWINGARQAGQYENIQVEFLIEARAREFGIPFVCADKCGLELPPIGYVGQSRIVGADGTLLAEAPPDRPEVIVADLHLQPANKTRIAESWRRRLLTASPAQPSEKRDTHRIMVAATPARMVVEYLSMGTLEAWLEGLSRRGVTMLVSDISLPEQRETILGWARRFKIQSVLAPLPEGLSDIGCAKVGCLSGNDAHGFAPARAMALDGADILLVFDMPEDTAMLRTRAVENRVFMIGAGWNTAVLVDPGGKIMSMSQGDPSPASIAEFDLALAADKLVAPDTNIFQQRQPWLYKL